jgi:hypothetical protein
LWKYYELSRYACYLIVQNGDPRKEVMALGKRREIKKHIDSHIMSGIIVVVSSRKISMEE